VGSRALAVVQHTPCGSPVWRTRATGVQVPVGSPPVTQRSLPDPSEPKPCVFTCPSLLQVAELTGPAAPSLEDDGSSGALARLAHAMQRQRRAQGVVKAQLLALRSRRWRRWRPLRGEAEPAPAPGDGPLIQLGAQGAYPPALCPQGRALRPSRGGRLLVLAPVVVHTRCVQRAAATSATDAGELGKDAGKFGGRCVCHLAISAERER
jgi:hypothetical protein